MGLSSPCLRRLDNALAALPVESYAMLLGELDGYLAGVIVCAEPILPGEWLPLVWGIDGQDTPFTDRREADWYAALVVEQHDAILRALDKDRDRYQPFFEIDARHDETLWELWIEGFAAAMSLRPASWARVAEGDDRAAAEALAGLSTLIDIARGESDLDRAAIAALTDAAPALIAGWIGALHAYRRAHGAAREAPSHAPTAKIGRNDPCGCGSGRKYKKCCGVG